MSPNQKIWEIDNLPNRLTIFRILLIPIILASLYLCKPEVPLFFESNQAYGVIAALCFMAAGMTDFFDGYIARKRNIVTVFGSFLDPIADKFLVISSLIMLLSLKRVPDFVVIILVLRELYMTSLRLLATNQGLSVPVDKMGKWKTAIQFLSITFLMLGNYLEGIPGLFLGQVCIYIAAFLALFSAVNYSIGLFKRMQQARKIKKKEKENE
ncbi:MAG: CDP-diacylglycerol--glycerol-3-phosphate 3-phosphatidyltransferase [Halobacteriovoraceae bacterium]|nr:CDP-diacylglycerol--glycerol-3-phosphate 3-phosphatidyltransferase [Halobacteriovoraceae bacterium]MCB9095181.1 CDP-diacylglycerol--glycerol-3-phosphate 3-phosphatidyltransferase [Halobacteriovoraceae bacterium]